MPIISIRHNLIHESNVYSHFSPCARQDPWLVPGSHCECSQLVGSGRVGVPPVPRRYRTLDCSWTGPERKRPSSPPYGEHASHHHAPQSSVAERNRVHSGLLLEPREWSYRLNLHFTEFVVSRQKLLCSRETETTENDNQTILSNLNFA